MEALPQRPNTDADSSDCSGGTDTMIPVKTLTNRDPSIVVVSSVVHKAVLDSDSNEASAKDSLLHSVETSVASGSLYASGPHGIKVPYPPVSIIAFEMLRFGRQVGSGGTSVVYSGHYCGESVAIKSFRCEMLTKEYIERFVQEMSLSVRLYHQNVVKCLGICVMPPSICIVTEFMERGV